MSRQSASIMFNEYNHKNIYYKGLYHNKMYLGDTLLWEKLEHPTYSIYMKPGVALGFDEWGGLYDEWGYYIDVNRDAIIEECAVCIRRYDNGWYAFQFACKGTNVKQVAALSYASYRGEMLERWLGLYGDMKIHNIPNLYYTSDSWGNPQNARNIFYHSNNFMFSGPFGISNLRTFYNRYDWWGYLAYEY